MTKEEAIALAQTGWWKDKPCEVVARFQLQEPLLCMDFGDFHGAVEKSLGRSVWTHEFANPNSLLSELNRDKASPSMQEILDLIPEHKRIVLTHEEA